MSKMSKVPVTRQAGPGGARLIVGEIECPPYANPVACRSYSAALVDRATCEKPGDHSAEFSLLSAAIMSQSIHRRLRPRQFAGRGHMQFVWSFRCIAPVALHSARASIGRISLQHRTALGRALHSSEWHFGTASPKE